uniref:Replication protein A 70 kDa DNA-binding subunit B/D first OB fold domain-containing protein n=1 Tax=Ananas comosus var. bracteatus TaxID=296719 RepID=A0A6V7NGW8_ANACO|nr:unnamed protein product [Ananas comosus var. bracteatus]
MAGLGALPGGPPLVPGRDSLDLILINEKGVQIHAVIKKVHATHFRPLIQEGKIYVISNFKVLPNRLSFRPVHNNYMISFYAITSIKEIKTDVIDNQRHQFEFLDFHDVPKRLNNDLHLIDVMGFLCGISEISEPNGDRIKIQKCTIRL